MGRGKTLKTVTYFEIGDFRCKSITITRTREINLQITAILAKSVETVKKNFAINSTCFEML